MNIFGLSGILITLSSSAMAILMFATAKQRLHYIWGVFCVAVAIWGIGAFKVAGESTPDGAEFWWRIGHTGIIFIPIFFTHFIYEFLGRKNYLFLWVVYLLGFFFLISDILGDLFIVHMRLVFNQFYYDSPPGLLYIPFTAFFFGLVAWSHLLLWRTYRIAATFQRRQIAYFFFATAIGFLGGGLSFLPVYGIDLYPVANLTVFLYPVIITYAILRVRLFDLRIVLTQFLVGVIAILLLMSVFASRSPFEYGWRTVLLLGFLFSGYLLIRSVLTEIKQREQLQEAYKKLEELDRSKSEFVSIASHQLRTPLTAMKGYISMILEGSYGSLDTKQKKPVESIYESSERLIRLVNDLLNVSRIEAGKIEMKWEQGSVEEIIKSVVEELAIKTREKNVKLVFEEGERSSPLILMDKEKIRNVVFNVVDNAIRYTLQGNITVNVKNHPFDKLLISVKDTGEGMTKEEIGKLFETFSRGGAGMKFSTEGAGLGLYIAKKFLEMHKGRIWAESPGKGKGSTFYVELPVGA